MDESEWRQTVLECETSETDLINMHTAHEILARFIYIDGVYHGYRGCETFLQAIICDSEPCHPHSVDAFILFDTVFSPPISPGCSVVSERASERVCAFALAPT